MKENMIRDIKILIDELDLAVESLDSYYYSTFRESADKIIEDLKSKYPTLVNNEKEKVSKHNTVRCTCLKGFTSEEALEQHQKIKNHSGKELRSRRELKKLGIL